jgi:hypothetical protein
MGALLRVAGHRRPGSRQLLAGKPLGLAKAFETKGMSVFAGRPPYGRGHHGKHRPTRAGRQSGVCHAKRAGDSTFSPSAASPITSRRGKPLPFLQADVGQSHPNHPNPTWQSEGPFFPPMAYAAGSNRASRILVRTLANLARTPLRRLETVKKRSATESLRLARRLPEHRFSAW